MCCWRAALYRVPAGWFAGSRAMNLIKALNPAISQYRDRRFHGNQQEFEECLAASTTVYVGNLSFYSTEDQVYEVRALTVWLPHCAVLLAQWSHHDGLSVLAAPRTTRGSDVEWWAAWCSSSRGRVV